MNVHFSTNMSSKIDTLVNHISRQQAFKEYIYRIVFHQFKLHVYIVYVFIFIHI